MIYDNFPADLLSGKISPSSDDFKLCLLRDYTPDAAHTRRSDVAPEEVKATGYDRGGKPVSCAVKAVGDRLQIVFDDVVWTIAGQLEATGGAVYKARGGPASEDELVCYLDFGRVAACTDGTFTAHFTSGIAVRASAQ
ncbi:MAG: hypothetical protein ACLQVI_00640 [Polyangiaceae bacterium]